MCSTKRYIEDISQKMPFIRRGREIFDAESTYCAHFTDRVNDREKDLILSILNGEIDYGLAEVSVNKDFVLIKHVPILFTSALIEEVEGMPYYFDAIEFAKWIKSKLSK